MYFEITETERDYLLRVMDNFVAAEHPGLKKDVIADIMMMYWRLHKSKYENTDNDS
jgi:hypothetical protein